MAACWKKREVHPDLALNVSATPTEERSKTTIEAELAPMIRHKVEHCAQLALGLAEATAELLDVQRGAVGRPEQNFPVYMERGMDVHPWSWIYFVSFVLVAAFIVLNVLIGIVLNSLEEAREIERRRARGLPEPDLDDPHLAPLMERIAILRAALSELEEELGHLRRAA
jgi:hypothetical protein